MEEGFKYGITYGLITCARPLSNILLPMIKLTMSRPNIQCDGRSHSKRCWTKASDLLNTELKVILCAYEHIFLIVRYRYISFKQLLTDPLHVLTDANVLVLVDTYQKLFVNGRFSLPSDIHRSIMYAYHPLIFEHRKFPETRLTSAISAS